MTITHIIQKGYQIDGVDYDIIVTLPATVTGDKTLLSSKDERIKHVIKQSLDSLKREKPDVSPSDIHIVIPLEEDFEVTISIASSSRIEQIAQKKFAGMDKTFLELLNPLRGLFKLGTLVIPT